ncbi:MAG: transposase [Gemmatimonadota bacterium]
MEKDEQASESVATAFRTGCPRCGHASVIRWGRFSGRQRYRCRACRGTFSTFTGTPLHYLKRIDRWESFRAAMERSLAIRPTAILLGVDKDTVFRWRHRILVAFESPDRPPLRQDVFVDCPAFRFCGKGQSGTISSAGTFEIPTPGNADPAQVGRIWVILARDTFGCARPTLVGPQRPRLADYVAALENRLTRSAVLVGDRGIFSPLARCARELKLPYRPAAARPVDGTNLRYVPRVRRWLLRFRGVGRRYFTRYLLWFHAMEPESRKRHRPVRWTAEDVIRRQF